MQILIPPDTRSPDNMCVIHGQRYPLAHCYLVSLESLQGLYLSAPLDTQSLIT